MLRNWKGKGVDFFKTKMRPAINRQYNPFANFDWGDTNWSGLAGTATSMLGEGIGSAVGMNEKQKFYANSIANYGQGVYDGLTDNSSLIMAGMMPSMSAIEQKDIRDKTWGEDIGSSLMNGLNAGLSTGNPYIGIGVAALDFANDLRERFTAKSAAEDLEKQRRDRMRLLGEQYYVAAQGVDEQNDFNRLMSYFDYPYDFAFGGPLHSNGGDYNGGLTYIDEGGRHEENPYEGVPSGFDEEGNPNLVEEGEVIWNNEYVFSDRLKVPKELATKYKLGGKKDYTFAEAIEKLTKENTISPNDFITIATTKEIVNEFMDAQEAIREENQLAAREELEAAQAQDFLAQLNAAQGMAPPMGAPIDMGQMSMGMPNEAPVTEGEMMPPGYAFGGNKFDGGGWEDFFKMLEEYRGSLGASSLAGRYAIDRNAKYWNNRSAVDIQKGADYQAFTKWVKEHKDDPNVQRYFEYLDKGINKSKGAKTLLKYDKDGKAVGLADGWDKIFEHRRTDNALGIYHLNPADIAFLSRKQPASVKVPDVALKDFDFDIPFDLDAYLASSNEGSKTDAPKKDDSQSQFKYRPTWQRYAPVIGSAMATLYGMFNRPDYTNADEVIKAARTVGLPINIPVETIGDYRKRNPYDERYLVNLANQNRAAGVRTMTNTSGGNRSMDMLGAMTLAHSNQYDLGEIMRQAYLANRQDDATVAEFNRGTNIQNMGAINQRNLTQAQLNSARQQAMLSGLERGYTMRQGIKNNWDDFTTESLESTLASLGAIGKENEEYNILTSMAEQGYFPYYYGDRSILKYVPYKTNTTKNGGKLNRKKRRF